MKIPSARKTGVYGCGLVASCLLLACACWPLAARAAGGALEAKVKAAYLFNFTRFVDWPSLPSDHLTICVSGADEVLDLLSQLAGRQAKGLPLAVERAGQADFGRCQVLFIGTDERQAGVTLAAQVRAGVLTVGDGPDFARREGIIGFYGEGGKVRLEINAARARAANLKISAKLLEVARIVP